MVRKSEALAIASNDGDVSEAIEWVSSERSHKLGLLFTAAWCRYCPAAKTAFTQVARGQRGGEWRFMIVDERTCPSAIENFEVDGFPMCIRVNSKREYECVTIDTLIAGATMVRPLAARKAAMDAHHEFVKCSEGLREGNVHNLAEEVWRHRGGVDAYSGAGRAEVNRKAPNVDHVAEVQLLNVAWCSALKAAPVGARTRTGKDRLQHIVNGVQNLNVTTSAINQAKKGPFIKFLKLVVEDSDRPYAGAGDAECLADLARQSKTRSVAKLFDDGIWDKIELSLQDSADATCEMVGEQHAELGVRGELFSEHLAALIQKMKLSV